MPRSNSLDQLVSRIAKGDGLAKPYNFKFEFSKEPYFPQTLIPEFNDMIQDVSVPSKIYSKQPVYYGGPLRNYPYVATYNGEITCTLILRQNDPIYNALHKWHKSVINDETNIVSFPEDYTCPQAKLTMEATNLMGKDETQQSIVTTTAEFTLYDLWPESVPEIPLSQSSTNEYIRYSITFSFRRWSREDLS